MLLFCLLLTSRLVYRPNFTLSKLRYLIYTKSKLLSLLSGPIVQGASSCWTSCTALLPHGDLWSCLCLCMVLQTALKCFILPHQMHFCNMSGTAPIGILWCSIYISVPFPYHFLCPFTVFYYHVSACLFLLSQRLLHLWCCLAPIHAPSMSLLSGLTSVLVCCSPHWYLSKLAILYNLCY